MMFNDFLDNPKAPHFADIPKADSFLSATHAESLTDKNVEKTFIAASKASFKQKTDLGMSCSSRVYETSRKACELILVRQQFRVQLLHSPRQGRYVRDQPDDEPPGTAFGHESGSSPGVHQGFGGMWFSYISVLCME
jgi:hypothetical protein